MGVLNIAIRLLGGRKSLQDMDSLSGSVGRLADGMATATAAGMILHHTIGQMLDRARHVEVAEEAFFNLGFGIGDADKRLGGFVNRQQLLIARNRSVQLGLNLTSQEFAKMTESAAKAGLVMGQDVNQSINDIILGIGRQSRLILDNLGIIVRVEKANRDYAESLGILVGQMSDAQTKIAFKIAALKGLERASKGVTLEATTAAGQWAIYKNRLEDAKNEVAMMVSESIGLKWAIGGISEALDNFSKGRQLERMRSDLGVANDKANELRQSIRDAFTFAEGVSPSGMFEGFAKQIIADIHAGGIWSDVTTAAAGVMPVIDDPMFGDAFKGTIREQIAELERMEFTIEVLEKKTKQFFRGIGDDPKKIAAMKEKKRLLQDEANEKERIIALNIELERTESLSNLHSEIALRTSIAKATAVQAIKTGSILKQLKATIRLQKLIKAGMSDEEAGHLATAQAALIHAEEMKALNALRRRGHKARKKDISSSRDAVVTEILLTNVTIAQARATERGSAILEASSQAITDNVRIRALEKEGIDDQLVSTLESNQGKLREIELNKALNELMDKRRTKRDEGASKFKNDIQDIKASEEAQRFAIEARTEGESRSNIAADLKHELAMQQIESDKALIDTNNLFATQLDNETKKTLILLDAKERLAALEKSEEEERRDRINAAASGFQNIASDLMSADAKMTAFRMSESKKRINATVKDENKRAFLIAKAEHRALVSHKKAEQNKAILGAAMEAARAAAAYASGNIAGAIGHAAAAAQFGIAAAIAGATVPSFVAPRRRDTAGGGQGARREAATTETRTYVTINVAPGGIASPETAGVVLQGMIDASDKFGRGIATETRVERI